VVFIVIIEEAALSNHHYLYTHILVCTTYLRSGERKEDFVSLSFCVFALYVFTTPKRNTVTTGK
jgi:hypothetical protein